MSKRRPGSRRGYPRTVGLVREYLRPVDPPPRLVVEIRDLRRVFGDDLRVLEEPVRRRRSGKAFLALILPFFGMASYLLAKHLLSRQDGVSSESMAASV